MSIFYRIEENDRRSCLMDVKHDDENIFSPGNHAQPDENTDLDKNPKLLWKEQNKTNTPGQDPLNRLLTDFLKELENNQQILNRFAGDKLLPLETSMWETNQRMVHHLIPNLKKNFARLYDDISQINHLVWLSTEFNHNSPSMYVQYTKMSEIIATNLDKMITRIRCFNQVEKALSLISIFD
jgi:hypothetical protein